MTQVAGETRQFSVHARHDHSHHPHILTEASFEAAAIAFAEDWPLSAEDHELSITVRDIQSGHEHCFRIDLDTGETAPCA